MLMRLFRPLKASSTHFVSPGLPSAQIAEVKILQYQVNRLQKHKDDLELLLDQAADRIEELGSKLALSNMKERELDQALDFIIRVARDESNSQKTQIADLEKFVDDLGVYLRIEQDRSDWRQIAGIDPNCQIIAENEEIAPVTEVLGAEDLILANIAKLRNQIAKVEHVAAIIDQKAA